MANLVRITNFKSEYSENLFSEMANFQNEPTINVTSGTMTSSYGSTYLFDSNKSLFLRPTSYDTTNIAFNFGTALQKTVSHLGNYFFTFRLLNPNTTNEFFVPFTMHVKLWEDGINTQTFTFQSSGDEVNDSKKWVTWGQSFNVTGAEIDFSFEIEADTSYPLSFITFYLDGFKLEYDDRFLNIPSIYSKPLEQTTAWQSKVDTVNTQNLTADTDNLIAFIGTDASNGGITLMDSLGKITPARMNDALSIDFVFSFPTPIGTDDYLSVKFIVDGVIYRAQSFNILAPTGETNYVAVSFNLPVETDFFANGGEFYVNPSVNITIANRYIQCTRTHKGI